MGNDLNFHTHIILTKTRNTDTSPDGLMTGHVLLKVAHHGCQCFVINGHMVRVDAENLVPAFTTSILQVVLDIGERLVDLLIDFPVKLAGLTVPTTYTRRASANKHHIQISLTAHLGRRIRSGLRF